jgi:hypothetical protein
MHINGYRRTRASTYIHAHVHIHTDTERDIPGSLGSGDLWKMFSFHIAQPQIFLLVHVLQLLLIEYQPEIN